MFCLSFASFVDSLLLSRASKDLRAESLRPWLTVVHGGSRWLTVTQWHWFYTECIFENGAETCRNLICINLSALTTWQKQQLMVPLQIRGMDSTFWNLFTELKTYLSWIIGARSGWIPVPRVSFSFWQAECKCCKRAMQHVQYIAY